MEDSQKATTTDQSLLSHLEGKYLTFALGCEQYGLNILDVFEIFGMKSITRVPRAPSFVKGVINLRGRIIPIIDLRAKFGLPEVAATEKTCIVVVSLNLGENVIVLGMIVDTVLEVRDFSALAIAAAPDYGMGINTNFIIGMGKHSNDSVTILIDINKVFANEETSQLMQANEQSVG